MLTRKLKIFQLFSIRATKLWFLSKTHSLIQFIALTFLSFILTISWTPIAVGQIPFLNINQTENQRYIIDFFNRPFDCGNFECSRVWFNGEPIFTVASYPIDQQDRDNALPIESRAKKVQTKLKIILQLAVEGSKNLQTTLSENPTIEQDKIETYPNTPKIQVSILNGETVIIFPEQFNAPQKTIITVTQSDVLYYNKTKEELAQEWQNTITSSINEAIKERNVDAENKFTNLQKSIIFMLLAMLFSLGVFWCQKLYKTFYIKIKRQLKIIEKSVSIDPEFAKTEDLKNIASQLNLEVNQQQNSPIANTKTSENTKLNLILNSARGNQILLNIQRKLLLQIILKISLTQQNILKQELNIISFIRRLLWWVQVFIWGFGIALILVIHYQTRAIGILIGLNTINILIIWVFVSLADKFIDYIIESLLHKWATNAQLENPDSGRYSLRVSTYSAALTSMTSIIFWVLGIVLTAERLGIATQVLASAGVVAIVVGYLSQNIVTDIIAGVLIFLNDSYAVGDVVNIAGEGGFVEKMNLYMTSLRNSDGELITIPHRSITTIKNLTKDWSRVNFTIEIDYNADIKKAIQVIELVAETMQSEVEWQDSFIESAAVLGVDEVSHSGILIRVWIKTPPLKQWVLGREFRLRVKQAFDREGISIGVPQRSLSVKNLSDFINEKQDGKTYSSMN